MIAIMFLFAFVFWLAVSIFLCYKLPRWFGMRKYAGVVSWLLFPLILVAPMLDDIIGKRQFRELCDTQAKVWVSPDWRQVKRATARDLPTQKLGISEGYVIPISLRQTEYYDKDTGKLFSSETSFSTYGGVLMRPEGGLGLGLGLGTQCWPPNWISAHREINLSQLLIKGE